MEEECSVVEEEKCELEKKMECMTVEKQACTTMREQVTHSTVIIRREIKYFFRFVPHHQRQFVGKRCRTIVT